MATRKNTGLLALLLGTLLMAGCQTTSEPVVDTGEPAQTAEAPASQPAVQPPPPPPKPEPKSPMVRRGSLEIPDPSDMTRLMRLEGQFYFDYDRAVVKSASFQELARHARYLTGNRDARVRLEGHCDERGTREYNLALGERRADAVTRYLMNLGVRRSQIETISYGEERPLRRGSNEAAWARNRRVELKYTSG